MRAAAIQIVVTGQNRPPGRIVRVFHHPASLMRPILCLPPAWLATLAAAPPRPSTSTCRSAPPACRSTSATATGTAVTGTATAGATKTGGATTAIATRAARTSAAAADPTRAVAAKITAAGPGQEGPLLDRQASDPAAPAAGLTNSSERAGPVDETPRNPRQPSLAPASGAGEHRPGEVLPPPLTAWSTVDSKSSAKRAAR